MKKKLCILCSICILLVASFLGCKANTSEVNSATDHSHHEESGFREDYGDKESRKALSICIDMGKSSNMRDGTDFATDAINRFVNDIKFATGMEQVSVLLLPGDGAERESLLDRLRVEILSGIGPDVFLLSAAADFANYSSPLVNFPEKSMANGLFLPLDEYMESNTRFTDWSKQTKVILDAGKSEEGQVIIPLAYTLPVVVYPKEEIKLEPSSNLTMQDILENPETADLGAVMYNGVGKKEIDNDSVGWLIHDNSLASMLGKLADFENEKLLFTEEDLMGMLDTMGSLRDTADKNQQNYLEENIGVWLCYQFSMNDFDEEMGMIPMYSREGGVTASITAYAAVNRNTAYPVEAYTVIDFLMQERMQQENEIYYIGFVTHDGIPLQDDLLQEEKPLKYVNPVRYLEEPYYEDLSAIKRQITNVNFRNELDVTLESIVSNWALEYLKSGTYDKEAVSEAYANMKRMVGE